MAPKENEKNIISFDYHVLFYAVKSGDYEKLEQLLDKNCPIVDNEWTDYKLLIYAVKCQQQLPIVELLVNRGCRVKAPKTNQYKTPLYYAVEGKKTLLVKFLIEAGASICQKDLNTDTPLYFALRENYFDAVDLMLSKYDFENIDSNSKDQRKHFNIACIRNSVKVVKCFIEKGIDVNAVQKWFLQKWCGYTPLHFAVEFKSVDVIKLLLDHGADFTKQNKNTMSPLHLAFEIDETDMKHKIVDLILKFHTTNTTNPVDSRKLSHFHISCTRNNSAVVKAFLQSGVDVNLPITLPNSLAGLSPLNLAVDFKKEEIVKLLLQHGADVNFVDDTNSTSLHLAVQNNDQQITKILLEYGADVNVKNYKNITPLYIAVKNRSYEIVKLLLLCDGDPSIGDKKGVSPIHMAYFDLPRSKEVLDLMLSANCNLTNTSDTDNFSILHIACILNNTDVVRKFFQNNIDKNACVSFTAKKWPSFTALHFAAYFYFYELVQLLLYYKVNVNLREENGYTPLWLAIKFRFNDDIANKLNEGILKNKSSSDGGVDEDEVIDFLFEEIKQLEIVHALVTNRSNLNSIDSNCRPLLFEAWRPQVIWNFSDNIANKSFIMSICSRFCDKNLRLTFQILIKHGIDLTITDENDISIFHRVTNSNRSECCNAYLHIDKKFFDSTKRAITDLLTAKNAE